MAYRADYWAGLDNEGWEAVLFALCVYQLGAGQGLGGDYYCLDFGVGYGGAAGLRQLGYE